MESDPNSSVLDENIDEQEKNIVLTDSEIFTKIWTSPRLVFRYINDNNYGKFVIVLMALSGIVRAFDQASTKNMGDDSSLMVILATCIILGGAVGWIGYFIFAALISWTGKWIKGQGNTRALVRMSAHAMIPSIVALVLLIPQIALLGKEVFQSEIDVYSDGLIVTIVFFTTVALEIILSIWTLVLFVIGTSEVQKFSIGKSILNIIIAVLVILVPIMFIVVIIMGRL